MEIKLEALELKAVEEGKNLYIEGYASVFGVVDTYNDIIVKGAFLNTIQGKNFKRIKFCYQHEFTEVIGKIVELREDEVGLWFKAKLSNTTKGKDVGVLVSDEAIGEISIGYRSVQYDVDNATGIRTLSEVELYEISLVSRAANSEALITSTEIKSEVEKPKEVQDLTDDELLDKKKELEQEIQNRILNKVK